MANAHESHPHIHEPVISKKWQMGAVLGNFAVGAAETAVGVAASALSVVTDGVHNAADVATYWLQSKNILDGKLNEKQRQRNRKIGHWIIAAASAGLATKAGTDLALDNETASNTLSVYAAGASLALNTFMFASLRKGIMRRKAKKGNGHLTHLEKDLNKHFLFSDMPSAALAVAGAVAHKYGVTDIEQAAAIASGTLSAYVFRPTKRNLRHSHDHFGEAVSNEHSTPDRSGSWQARKAARRERRNLEIERPYWQWVEKVSQADSGPMGRWAAEHLAAPDYVSWKSRSEKVLAKQPKRRLRAALASGFAAVVLTAGLGGDVASSDQTPQPLAPVTAEPGQLIPDDVSFENQKLHSAVLTECVTVDPGDSQWSIAEERIENVTGLDAEAGFTNILTILSAGENLQTNPDHDLIHVGQCLEVPTEAVIAGLQAHMHQPNSPLADAIEHLNNFDSLEEAANQTKLLDEIRESQKSQ